MSRPPTARLVDCAHGAQCTAAADKEDERGTACGGSRLELVARRQAVVMLWTSTLWVTKGSIMITQVGGSDVADSLTFIKNKK